MGVGIYLGDVNYQGKKLGGFMDWMQLGEIVASMGLVVVTFALFIATNMYRKATDQMVKIQHF